MKLPRRKKIAIFSASLLILVVGAASFYTWQKHQSTPINQPKPLTLEERVARIKIPAEASSSTKQTVFQEDGYKVTTLPTSNINNPVKFATNDNSSISITTLDNPKLGTLSTGNIEQQDNKTIYENAYNAVDLVYTRKKDSLLEEFELRNHIDFDEIVQKIDISNLIYKKQSDGSILFYEKDSNKFAFAIPKPVMYEKLNSQARSYGLHYEIIEGTNGKTYLIKVLDQKGKDWLAKASYPVEIDATIVLTISGFESYPIYNDTWQIRLDTVGIGDLEIAPAKTTTWQAEASTSAQLEEATSSATQTPNQQADLQFVSLKCGEQEANYQIVDNKLTASNLTCNDNLVLTTKITSQDPKQYLSFKYGDATDPSQFTQTTIETPTVYSKPIFLSSSLNPNAPKVGDPMLVKSHILDNEGITEVKANMADIATITLNRVSGTDKNGEYEGTWITEGTIFKQYPVTITAKNASTQTDSVVAFFDAWTCTGGGDHAGIAFNPTVLSTDGTAACASNEIAGLHTGITTFTVPAGTVSVKDYNGTSFGFVEISATTVTITGTLSGDARGYRGGASGANGEGTGGGINGTAGGSGGHGGAGGRGGNSGGSGGAQNGSLTIPGTLALTNMGSGGGGGGSGKTGGDGGGAIKLTATGTTTISGTITSNGANGTGDGGCCNNGSGSGAGGGIYISTDTFASGAGTVRANGGAAAASSNGSGGGGGRIALQFTTANSYTGTITVSAGAGDSSGAGGTAGTAYLYDATNDDITVPAANGGSWNASDFSDWDFRNITINGSVFFQPQSATLLTITSSGTTTFGGSSQTVTMGGSSSTSSNGVGVYLNLTGNVTIPSTTTISADSRGYSGGGTNSSGSGQGGGTGSSSNSGGGGAHGGNGGTGVVGGGGVYDSLTAPVKLGSGGGAGQTSAGGTGAGAIRLDTTGTLTVSGTISANGAAGVSDGGCCGKGGGGGAGGSIYMNAATFAGAGTIRANGGSGGTTNGTTGGGGAGGRIAVYYTSASTYNGTMTVTRGTSGGSAAEFGTAFIEDTGNTDIIIPTANGRWYASDRASWSFRDLTINGSADFAPTSQTLLTIVSSRTTTIGSGVTITTRSSSSTSTNGVGVYFNLTGDVTIPLTSSISGDGVGYAGGATNSAGSGQGAGSGSSGASGGGGAHGGNGGTGGVGGGSVYDSLTAPVKLGSGGGAGQTSTGGAGGSAIRLDTTGTLTVTGTISSNGAAGVSDGGCCQKGGGGGAGGSIYINALSFAGAGTVRANGGAGGTTNGTTGGDGSGGRVAVYYTSSNSFNGTMTATKGTSGTPSVEYGTAFIENSSNHDIIIPSANGRWYASDRVSWVFHDLSITGAADFAAQSATLLTITSTGTTTIAASTTISLRGSFSTNSNGQGVFLNLTGNVTLPSTSVINANSLGYSGGALSNGSGSGTGRGTGGTSAGSGGYGGAGGSGNSGAGGGTYGSSIKPTDLGSGGGASTSFTGGAGGGAIKIQTTGSLIVNGTIRSNGGGGDASGGCCNLGSGGGSGGSIYLYAPTFAGSGTLQAIGGSSTINGNSSGGGGGRIAIWYNVNTWGGSTLSAGSATAGGSGQNANGASGTVTLNCIYVAGANNLLGSWNFEEGTGTTTYANNSKCTSHTGTITNMTSPATSTSGWTNSGKFGRTLIYDGTNDYVQIPDSDGLAVTGDITVSAWIKLTDTSGTYTVVAKNGSSGSFGYRLWTDTNGKINFAISDDGTNTTSITGTTTLSTGTWYQVEGVFDGSTSLAVYVNGKIDGQNTTSIPAALNNPVVDFYFGANTNGTANFFKGSIDNILLYNYARDTDQVKVDKNQVSPKVVGSYSTESDGKTSATSADRSYCVPGDTASCSSPLLQWKFDEGTGSTANDTTGKANSGTLTSSPVYVNGKVNKALSFNGSTNYVVREAAPLGSAPGTNYTLSAWFRLTSLGAQQTIVEHSGNFTANNTTEILLSVSAGNQLGFSTRGDSFGTTASVNSPLTLTTNTWYYAAGVVSSGTMHLYLNGTEQGTPVTAATLGTHRRFTVGTEGSLSGSGSFEQFFTGQIDEVEVYNYGRTAAQVAWEYNKGGPSASYRLDGCTGSSVIDSTGNANTGTITIGASGSQTTTGSCSVNNSAAAWYNGATGKFNSSLNFDGTDDFITIAAFSPLASAGTSANKVSWGGWFYPTTSAASKTLLEKATEFRITTDASGNAICGIYYSAAFHDATTVTAPLTLATWNHVICTYDGANIKTYINGLLRNTTANTNNITAASSILYLAENSSSAQRFEGQIDEVRIYNYNLNIYQIALILNNNAALRLP